MKRVGLVTSAITAIALVLMAGVFLSAAEEKAGEKGDRIRFASYARDDNNTQHVFYRNNDGSIIELWSKYGDPKGWNAKDLTAEAKAPKAAGSPAAYFLDKDNTQHVVYRGADGNIYELFYMEQRDRTGSWQVNNLTQLTGAPRAAGNPAGYVNERDNSQHVLYRSSDGDVIELFNARKGDNKGWQHQNLTGNLKAPKAEGDPDGYFLRFNNSQHVVYRDKEGNIHELFLGEGQQQWQHVNLMGQTKAPKADGDPCGYVATNDNTQHVVYRSSEGDIIELYHVPQGRVVGWHAKNLTAEAQAPKAEGNPVGYFVQDNNTQHIIYRDRDGNLQELFLKERQERWMHNNLTQQAKAPKAASDPSGYYLDKDKTQHVIFRSQDGQIIELYHRAAGEAPGWHANNLSAALKIGR
ncbi:MAG TPA: hypothetical protein VNK04_18740 [Gemmataceae bacterium]|nr:hypothetical protein [Gemmataceae bacterium]